MKNAFKESIDKAVNNANLTGALGKFSEAYKVNRAKAYEGIDFEELRAVIAERKSYAAGHLEQMAADFTRNAEALGAKVFQTSDPEEVKKYILKVARDNNVKTVVKSKSMATEEIHLNSYLEKAGIEVGETDLGEWIIQLAGQTPSHMVMPAIHMTKEEVSDLFSKEVDERLTTDIPQLVEVARNELRSKFLAADMGITGGNIAVAETGSIVLDDQRGECPDGHHPAEDPHRPGRHRKIGGKICRCRPDSECSAPQRHGPAPDQLCLHHHRPDAQHRRLHEGAAYHPHGQPPQRDGR